MRPYKEKTYEIGFRLRPKFWGQGFATEAATAVMEYACTSLGAERLFAGHHPDNKASQKFLENLAFNIPGMNFMNQPDYIILLMNGKSKPGGCVKIAEGEVYHEGI